MYESDVPKLQNVALLNDSFATPNQFHKEKNHEER